MLTLTLWSNKEKLKFIQHPEVILKDSNYKTNYDKRPQVIIYINDADRFFYYYLCSLIINEAYFFIYYIKLT